MIQVFTKDCLSVHHIRLNEKNEVYTVVIEPEALEDAIETGNDIDKDFEKFYPSQHPHHLVVVAVNGKTFQDNYKAVFDWVVAKDKSEFDWTKPFQVLDFVA